ncbi:PAS domain-containing protein [Rhizobium sp. P32RR-XVIII]|uniref:PAS domain-containing protein n=1 Tax=Rhizobium sp. P32RR-XVIII TaxID=2726738 RepID=UPI0014578BF4|nr:PAS domain-containing protein [Rhizobium sp. P32RR-XVIII]NLS07818.1 PAS domain-containing protein [Rhizobium sp. P32RR-XVIII]
MDALVPAMGPLEEVLDAIMELQHADFGDVQLYDASTGTLRLVVQSGFADELLTDFRTVDASDTSACGQALKQGNRIIVEDVSRNPGFAFYRGIAKKFGFRAVQSTPLIDRNGARLGVLSTHFRRPHRPSERDLHLTGLYARQAADVISLVLAEQRLRESEERFRNFAQNSADVLWILDAESKQPEYLSPAFTRIWGESQDIVLGNLGRFLETVHPEDRQAVIAALDAVLQKGEVIVQEYRIIRPDGSVRWISDTHFPIRDEHGTIRRIGGIAKDVTRYDEPLVYVIDVEDGSREQRILILQEAGYQVKAFASARQFLEVAPALVPGCVLLDTAGSPEGGVMFPKELKARQMNLPVIIVGDYNTDVRLAIQAMKAGAADVLRAPCAPETLLTAVASALAELREPPRASDDAQARIGGLSPREREVLDGLVRGGTNKTIARELGLSPRTVELYRAHLMERLGVRTLPEAIVVAASAGLIPLHLRDV